ncbi:MAG: cyclic pyranopterin monophosphate synthase MoaC [Bacteroidales bacterium]|nr:cyclic pyranopterin monophosphate synthase MoaC [Bacteroidales bacterium]
MEKNFSHLDESGKAQMVDISNKPSSEREALARGIIKLKPQTIDLIKQHLIKKGDVITIAEIAGIQAAKKASELIPLCHPIQLTKIDVTAIIRENEIEVKSLARCVDKTGVEMEALTAVSIALLTIYDMCKAVDDSMSITDISLVYKTKKP